MAESSSPNPYAVPRANVVGPEPASNGAAAIVGAAIAIGFAYASTFVLSLGFLWTLVAQGNAAEDAYARLYQSNWYLLIAHALGFTSSLLGGYWSAHLSRERPLPTGLLAGCITSCFALVTLLLPYEVPIPLWSEIAAVIIPAPTFPLGAWYWQRSTAAARFRVQ